MQWNMYSIIWVLIILLVKWIENPHFTTKMISESKVVLYMFHCINGHGVILFIFLLIAGCKVGVLVDPFKNPWL